MPRLVLALTVFLLSVCYAPAQDTPGSKLDAELAAMKARLADAERRLLTLEGVIPPPPPAPGRTLKGGFRLSGADFSRGTIGVDWTTRTLRLAPKDGLPYLLEYRLPENYTAGTDVSKWEILQPRQVPLWWQAEPSNSMAIYANGIAYFRGKWWVSPKAYYDGSPPSSLRLYAEGGETLTYQLPRQAFAGFVKRKDGEPLIGGGGYESGQGSVAGPSLATLAGAKLIDPPSFTSLSWELRQKRPPNYSFVGPDSWMAMAPRSGEGRWCSDRVFGGGLILPEGVTYWALLGTGPLAYANQTLTFAPDSANRTYEYRFDPITYALKSFTETTLGRIGGQEIDPRGRVWLCEVQAWKEFLYREAPVLKVFE